ncbi:MAG: helix-turn-helix domain-containing protein [Synergistaceae bacterium]|nr:helix-turn-helix domain-containing protein [Synergistaceae bacterium]
MYPSTRYRNPQKIIETSQQTLRQWMGASRYVYNQTIRLEARSLSKFIKVY